VRRTDPIALLESQAVTRAQDLVPVRYGRMMVSPFTFYRGAALVMEPKEPVVDRWLTGSKLLIPIEPGAMNWA